MRELLKKKVVELGNELHLIVQDRLRGKGYFVLDPVELVVPSVSED